MAMQGGEYSQPFVDQSQTIPSEILQGENIICIALHGWDTLWSRVQPLMSLLARHGNRVVYVEPITSLLTRLMVPEYRAVPAGLIPKIRTIQPGLWVLTPPMLLPFASRSALTCVINQRIFQRVLRRVQAQMDFHHPIIWTYSPYTVHLLGRLGEKLVLYDCTDERTANPLVGKAHIARLEEELMRQVDLVFVTARGLLARKKSYNPRTFLAPNGVDFQHFAAAWSTPLAKPADLQSLSRPIIGFVGAIAYWIDLDLIRRIATERPDWMVVLIGPVRASVDVSDLVSLPNVIFLGQKDWTVLPQYLRHFDVCISPFRLDEPITQTVNPLKVYEYLAAGRPVVSVDMPEIRHLVPTIRIARTASDFVDQIAAALTEKDAVAQQARVEVARAYDWTSILADMSIHIRECLA